MMQQPLLIMVLMALAKGVYKQSNGKHQSVSTYNILLY